MNWLRKILGLAWRDERIAELEKGRQLYKELTEAYQRDQTVLLDAQNVFTKKIEALTIPPLRHDETYAWTAADASAWKSFIGSDLGKKFIAVTRAAHYRMLQAASASQLYAAQEVHCARGFFECIKWMHLMTVPPASGAREQNNTVAGAGDSTATDPVQDDHLERYSPK